MYNQLTELNIENTPVLLQLVARYNNLTELIISSSPELQNVSLLANQLDSINLSGCSNLRTLECTNNNLEHIDLTNCPDLSSLYCSNNSLTQLNLQANTLLQYFMCFDNRLITLDISNNDRLSLFHCHNNQISSATNIDHLSILSNYNCSGNLLGFTQITPPADLTHLSNYVYSPQKDIIVGDSGTYGYQLNIAETADLSRAYDEGITSYIWTDENENIISDGITNNGGGIFSFSESLAGWQLKCEMVHPDFPDLVIRTLPFWLVKDLSLYDQNELNRLQEFLMQPSAIDTLSNGQRISDTLKVLNPDTWPGIVWNNQAPKKVSEIRWDSKNLAGTFDLSGFDQLSSVNVIGNSLSEVNVSGATSLTNLACSYNFDSLKSLIIDNNPALQYLTILFTDIDSVELSSCSNLLELRMSNTQIRALDLNHMTDLSVLRCSGSNLSQLDISNNPNLKVLNCSGNSISELDLTNNPLLYNVSVGGGELANIDISMNPLLESFGCYSTQIEQIDFSNNPVLSWLSLDDNLIDTLDLTQNPNIEQLSITSNRLSSINLDNQSLLTELYCTGNFLEKLDLTNQSGLLYLYCEENNISELQLADQLAMNQLICENNMLSLSDLSEIKQKGTPDYFSYAPQAKIEIGQLINEAYYAEATDTIDLSTEYLNGNTSYTWRYTENNDIIETGITELGIGKFIFDIRLVDTQVYCELTNSDFSDFSGADALVTVPLNIAEKSTSKLNSINHNLDLQIFPTMADNSIRINSTQAVSTIKIINSSGSVVYQNSFVGDQQDIDISDLESGIYYLVNQKGQCARFIKK